MDMALGLLTDSSTHKYTWLKNTLVYNTSINLDLNTVNGKATFYFVNAKKHYTYFNKRNI